MSNSVTRANVVHAAERWLGTPFQHAQRNEHGVDCLGLVVCVAKDLGLQIRDWLEYKHEGNADRLLDELKQQCTPTKQAPGVIVCFTIRRSREAYQRHLGIVTANGFIHAYQSARQSTGKPAVVSESYWNDRWKARVEGYWDLPGVTN